MNSKCSISKSWRLFALLFGWRVLEAVGFQIRLAVVPVPAASPADSPELASRVPPPKGLWGHPQVCRRLADRQVFV